MDPLEELDELQVEFKEVLLAGKKQEKELSKRLQSEQERLYQRRYKLVSGQAEPTEEELGGTAETTDAVSPTAAPGPAAGAKHPKGVPYFWLTVLRNQDTTSEHVRKRDEAALAFLQDIRCSKPKDAVGFRMEFHFGTNPYFTNKVLVKEVVLEIEEGGLSSAVVREGGGEGQIGWLSPEMNLTLKGSTRSGGKKKGKGKGPAAAPTPAAVKYKPCASFFSFFSASRDRKKRVGSKGKAAEERDDDDERGEEDDQEDDEPGWGGLGGGSGMAHLGEAQAEMLWALWNEVVPNAADLFTSESGLGGAQSDSAAELFEMVSVAECGAESAAPAVRRRIRALQHLHKKSQALLQEVRASADALLQEQESKLKGLLDRRRRIVVGDSEPPILTGDPEIDAEASLAIPRFWLLALKGCPTTVELIRKRDEQLLAFLADIRVRQQQEGGGFWVDFEFRPNPFLASPVLSKEFRPAVGSDDVGGGAMRAWGDLRAVVVGGESTRPQWKTGVLPPTMRVGKKGMRSCASFFHLFSEDGDTLLFGGDARMPLSRGELRAREADLALALHDVLVPEALPLYRTAAEWVHSDDGEKEDEDDEDTEEDEDEDEEEEEADDESGVDSGDAAPGLSRRELRRRVARGARGAAKGRGRKGRGRGGDDEEEGEILCCGLSRNAVLLLLLVFMLTPTVFLYIDMFGAASTAESHSWYAGG